MGQLDAVMRFVRSGKPRSEPEEIYTLLVDDSMPPEVTAFVDLLVGHGLSIDLGAYELYDRWLLDKRPPGLTYREGCEAQTLWLGRSPDGEVGIGIMWNGPTASARWFICEVIETKEVVPISFAALLDKAEFIAIDTADPEEEAVVPPDIETLRGG